MSSFQDKVNAQLRRDVSLSDKYDKYIPPSDCSSVSKLGVGDTKFAIDGMAKTAYKYQHHTKELTKKFFNIKPLSQLCQSIHSFLFNNLQYSLDGEDQKLRSPACSWRQRFEGIDCKS